MADDPTWNRRQEQRNKKQQRESNCNGAENSHSSSTRETSDLHPAERLDGVSTEVCGHSQAEDGNQQARRRREINRDDEEGHASARTDVQEGHGSSNGGNGSTQLPPGKDPCLGDDEEEEVGRTRQNGGQVGGRERQTNDVFGRWKCYVD